MANNTDLLAVMLKAQDAFIRDPHLLETRHAFEHAQKEYHSRVAGNDAARKARKTVQESFSSPEERFMALFELTRDEYMTACKTRDADDVCLRYLEGRFNALTETRKILGY